MKVSELMSLFERAKTEQVNQINRYKDAYKYGIPQRDMVNNTTKGTDHNFDLYDSTLVDSTENFANMLHEGMVPPESKWFTYKAGPEIQGHMREKTQALLDGATDMFFHLLAQTNFDTEINQCMLDVAAGTAALGIRDYDDGKPATFIASPPYELFILEGREGFIDTIFRQFKLDQRQVKPTWPKSSFVEQKTSDPRKGDHQEVQILECCYYDHVTRKHMYKVLVTENQTYPNQDTATEIYSEELIYPAWLVFRWSVVSGEIHGRGPILKAIPDAKTANAAVELILKNASISAVGVYTGVEDGVLNPATAVIAPGVIIPVAYNGGALGRSLDVLPRAGDFDVSQLVLSDLRQSIRRKMYDDDLAPLDQAVRSSREVAARMQKLAKRVGPNYGRMKTEFLAQFIYALTTMWGNKGLMPKFEVDGKLITLRYTSPIAQQQNDDDLQALDSYLMRMNAHTQGLASIVVPPEEYAHYVAEKTGIPSKLVASKEKLVQAQQVAGQAISEGGPAGQALAEGLKG